MTLRLGPSKDCGASAAPRLAATLLLSFPTGDNNDIFDVKNMPFSDRARFTRHCWGTSTTRIGVFAPYVPHWVTIFGDIAKKEKRGLCLAVGVAWGVELIGEIAEGLGTYVNNPTSSFKGTSFQLLVIHTGTLPDIDPRSDI